MSLSRRDFLIQTGFAAAGMGLSIPAFEKKEEAAFAETGFKISVFSKNLHWLDYQGMAALVAKIGFDGVDLTVRPGGHVLPERVADDLPKAVEAVRKTGKQIYLITTAITDAGHPHTEAILKAASKAGILQYRMGWLNYDSNLSIPQNLEVFKAAFRKLADLNKKYSIKGVYQNHSGNSLGASLWDLWTVLKDLDSQWIGCQHDVRHATVEGAHSWETGLKLLLGYIHSIDIKDFHWSQQEGKWQEENVPLGRGMVNFKKYFELLKTYQINCPISVHYEYPLGGAEEGARELSIDRKMVEEAMQKDLITLKGWLKEAGLG